LAPLWFNRSYQCWIAARQPTLENYSGMTVILIFFMQIYNQYNMHDTWLMHDILIIIDKKGHYIGLEKAFKY